MLDTKEPHRRARLHHDMAARPVQPPPPAQVRGLVRARRGFVVGRTGARAVGREGLRRESGPRGLRALSSKVVSLSIEQSLRERGFDLIAGADEVGRGALAGPLYAAAVILPPDPGIDGLRDSKLCTPEERERLAVEIRARAVAMSVVRMMPHVIDRRGLHRV